MTEFYFRTLPYQIQHALLEWEWTAGDNAINRMDKYPISIWIKFMKEENIYKEEFDDLLFPLVYG